MTIIIGIFFALLTAVIRILPHAPNFVPAAALGLWAGSYLPKKTGLALPLLIMFSSDALIGFYDWRLMLVVYASIAITVPIGWLVRKHLSIKSVILGSLTGSLFFFLTTNFAVWVFSSWYPHTFSGLLYAYTMGLPFARNTFIGDLFYNGVFFSTYALVTALYLRKVTLRKMAVNTSVL